MRDPVDRVRAAATHLFRTQQAANAFLESRCPALGGVPLKLVKEGRTEEVLAFIEKLEKDAPAPPTSLDRLLSGWLGRFGRRG